jgi:hypothetical protein
VRLALARAAESQVPTQAESAFVRVSHPTSGFLQIKQAPIPAPGTTAEVAFSVPVGAGYSVAVVAYRRDASSVREALAGGKTDNVTVSADQPSRVSIDVVPWAITINAPTELVSGQQATFTATLTQGPTDGFLTNDAFLIIGLTPWTTLSDIPGPTRSGLRSGNQLSITANAPTVDADTAVRIQFNVRLNHFEWNYPNFAIMSFHPSLTLGGELHRIPVKRPAGSLIVTFDKRP